MTGFNEKRMLIAKGQAFDLLITLYERHGLLDHDHDVDCPSLVADLVRLVNETKALREVLYEIVND